MPDLIPETRTGSGQQRWESPSPSSSPIGGVADPDEESVAGTSKSTRNQASSHSSSRGNLVDSDLDTASGDCLSCSDTDEVSIRMAGKKYRKRVRASCKLSKGTDWMDTQMKRIEGGHQDVWGHDHKIIRTEQKHTLADDPTSFKMRRMATRTNQLICIARATGSKLCHGVWGRGSRPGKGLSPVCEAVSCSLLQTLWKGDN